MVGPEMKTFELTQMGFDVESNQSEDCIWWVKAPTFSALNLHLARHPIALTEPARCMQGRDEQISPEEADFGLDDFGNLAFVNRKYW